MMIDFIATAPKDVALLILRKLNEQDLAICCMVSTIWNERASDDSLWRYIFPGLHMEGDDVKGYINEIAVKSIGGVLRLFQQTLSDVPPDKIVNFRCLFPFNPERFIEFTFGYGNVKHEKKVNPDITEYCIFTKRVHVDDRKARLRICQDLSKQPYLIPTVLKGHRIILPNNEEITSPQLASLIEAIYQKVISELIQAGKVKYQTVYSKSTTPIRRQKIKPIVGSSFPRMYGSRRK